MKILKLSPYCFPEQVSSSHLTNDLYEAYQKVGIETEIYCPTPTRGIDNETREKYKNIKYEERYDGTVKIHRFSMFREGRNPIMRAIRYIFCNIIQYFKGCRAKDIDLIFAASTPPTQGLLCALIKKKLKVPFIYNLQDIFPDSLVNTGLTKKESLLWKIGRKIENFTYKNADIIIVISNDIKKNIVEKGVSVEKIRVIPNWIDTDKVKPVLREDNKLFDELEISRNFFYVTYAGNLGYAQGISTILDAAEILKNRNDVQFVIFGEGAEKESIENRIKRIKNVKLFPLMSQERVAEVYSLGDVSLVTCKKGFAKGAIPSKTYSIMATGTPIILCFDNDSELWNLIKDNDCGYLCDADNARMLAEVIVEAKENKQILNIKSNNVLALVNKKYSRNRGTSAYISLIHELINQKDYDKGNNN